MQVEHQRKLFAPFYAYIWLLICNTILLNVKVLIKQVVSQQEVRPLALFKGIIDAADLACKMSCLSSFQMQTLGFEAAWLDSEAVKLHLQVRGGAGLSLTYDNAQLLHARTTFCL